MKEVFTYIKQNARPLALAGITAAALYLGGRVAKPTSADQPIPGVTSAILAQHRIEDLVVVTEDKADPIDGCDAVSIFDVRTGQPLFKGKTVVSPSRLASDNDLSSVVAINSNAGTDFTRVPEGAHIGPFIYRAQRQKDQADWTTNNPISGRNFTFVGGIAVTLDNQSVLISESESVSTYKYDPNFYESMSGPYSMARYSLSVLNGGNLIELGRASFGNTAPAEIIPTTDAHAHVVLTNGEIATLDTNTLFESASRIKTNNQIIDGKELTLSHPSIVHASITADERYIVTNRWGAGEVNIADLDQRTSTTYQLDDVEMAGGVAFNHARLNSDLLAVHTRNSIVVYRFENNNLYEIGRVATDFNDDLDWWFETNLYSHHNLDSKIIEKARGPRLSIAWSTDGSYLIAANMKDEAEFMTYKVEDNGRIIKPMNPLVACEYPGPESFPNIPNDILTLNERLRRPHLEKLEYFIGLPFVQSGQGEIEPELRVSE